MALSFPALRPRPPGLIPRQFRRDGVVFIHVPKCAGSALLDAYLGFQTGHVTATQYRQADPAFFDSAYVFTFVRDPLARFVSAYDHIQTGDLWDYLPEMKRLVDRFGATVGEVAERLDPAAELFSLPWFAPQHTFLEIRGRLAINRAFKTESFASDLDVIRAETSVRFRDIAPVNRRGAPADPPAARLGAAAVANLRRVYARDFTLFGYY
ncbi:MAG: sulfotransferase family 2 domain-containing protein [Planctomycetota bacterium]